MALSAELEAKLRDAIKHFWGTRETQAQKQGTATGLKDAGARSAVTGGAQACFLMSDAQDGPKGIYYEPSEELTFEKFVTSLMARAIARAKIQE